MYTFTSACTHIHPLVLHVHVHIYSANSFMYSTCMYIIIPAHWIYLYIIQTKAEKIVLTFKSFIPLANINFGEYCEHVPETLRPIFCLSFHSSDAKSE